jgi:DNA polymerase-3 subunit alpha
MYLNCKTYYSFRFGTFSTEELVKTAVDKGVSTLALTNINSTCDVWEFVKQANKAGIKPIAGAEVRNDDQLLYILLSATNKGLSWIHTFLSEHLINKNPFPKTSPALTFFENTTDGFVIFPLGAKSFSELLPNERVGVLPWEVGKLHSFDWKNHKEKLVIRQPVTFQNKTYFNLHRLLRSISKNCLLSQLPVEAQASEKETFVSPSQLLKSFEQFPFIVTNTYQLMDACKVSIDFDVDKNKQCYSAGKKMIKCCY